MRETSTAPLIGWSRRFPATPDQAGEARRFLTALLQGRSARDAILCLSELVANEGRGTWPGQANGHDGQRRMTAARPHALPGEERGVNGLTSTRQ